VAFLAIVAGWGSGLFSVHASGLAYPWFAFCCVLFVCLMAWVAILMNSRTSWELSKDLSSSPGLPQMTDKVFTTWNCWASGLFAAAILLFFLLFVVPIECALIPENRVLTYWRAMHLASGVSPILPVLSILVGLYLSFWFTLHGLALFGPDRPCLPPKERLALKVPGKKDRDFLRMFSQEDAAARIELAARPLNGKIVAITSYSLCGVSRRGLRYRERGPGAQFGCAELRDHFPRVAGHLLQSVDRRGLAAVPNLG
jgi:hypothetical protein